jgi:hypothetical protein
MGKITKIPFEEYLRIDALSGSDIVNFSRTPADFLKGRTIGKEKTAAMRKGTLLHCLVLEPQEFKKRYCIEPTHLPNGEPMRKPAIDGSMRKTKEGKAYYLEWEAENAHKICVSQADYNEALIQKGAVHLNPDAVRLLKKCTFKEAVLEWEFEGIKCKGQVDAFCPGLLVDLKTTANVEPDKFEADAYKRRYHQKMAWYKLGLEACGYVTNETAIISVCYDECIVRPMTDILLERGHDFNMKALEKYRECVKADSWPGWPSSVPMGTPQWAMFDNNEF